MTCRRDALTLRRMKNIGVVGLAALLIAACEDQPAAPPPKAPETTAVQTVATPPPPAPAAPVTEIPATSTNPEALAAYRTALDLGDNVHIDETRAALKKALSLDPSFASAMVTLGGYTPGAEGDALIANGIAKSQALPEAEQVFLQQVQAEHLGDNAKKTELLKKLVGLVPQAARAHYYYGSALNQLADFDNAKAEYRKALDLNPDYAPVLNDLGYLELLQGEVDASINHLQKYASLRPKEPNAPDSLGDALLYAGKLDEADASYKKAISVDPSFTISTTGSAFVSLYKGDATKGLDALTKYRDGLSVYDRKAPAYNDLAWAQAAVGKVPEAMKTIDAWEADAKKANDPEAIFWPQIARAELLAETGKPEEALKQNAAVVARLAASNAPDARKARWRLYLATDETILYGRAKKAAEAEKSRAVVDSLLPQVGGYDAKVQAAFAHGSALLAKGDAAGAVKEFSALPESETFVTWERMKAEEKAGLKTEAAATKTKLQNERRRGGAYFFVWSKIAPPKK